MLKKKYYPQEDWEVKIGDKCPEGYQLRPHVVWFGEAVPMLEKAAMVVAQAEIFVVVGTSLNVYPAAGLVDYAPNNCKKFLIDPKSVVVADDFNVIQESASSGVGKLKDMLLS